MAVPLGLPHIPSQLKSIVPYLQRAQEVRQQDPVVAYWCAYYAAQLGISLKRKDSVSRDVLFALLGILEDMKREIGAHDALENESVSIAYVENFALRVFAAADNEDRLGNATRATAKKFLASANFLEVLKTFSESKLEIPEATSEKIKYAKWKATDIARAFREGRKPTPGPAGSEVTFTQPEAGLSLDQPGAIDINDRDDLVKYSPPHQDAPRPPSLKLDATLNQYPNCGQDEGLASGRWSTAATPGTIHELSPNDEHYGPSGAEKTVMMNGEPDPYSVQFSLLRDPHGIIRGADGKNETKKSVRFSPSVQGGLSESSVAGSSPPASPPEEHYQSENDGVWPATTPVIPYQVLPIPIPHPPSVDVVDVNVLPPGFVPNSHLVWPAGRLDPSPGDIIYQDPLFSTSAPTPLMSGDQRYIPHSPVPLPTELPPAVIGKIQKHCRFAISALDYEDAEQARKELRNALALLG